MPFMVKTRYLELSSSIKLHMIYRVLGMLNIEYGEEFSIKCKFPSASDREGLDIS